MTISSKGQPIDLVLYVSTKDSLLRAPRAACPHPGATVLHLLADPSHPERFAGYLGYIEIHILDPHVSRRILETLRGVAPEEEWIKEY